MSALEDRIRRGLAADVAVPADDMIAAAAAGAQRSRRQQRWAVGIGTAAAVLTVVVGALAVTRGHENTAPPVGPSPSETPSVTRATDPADRVHNGPIVGVADLFAQHRAPCNGCAATGSLVGYDDATQRALWVYYDLFDTSGGLNPLAGLAVVGPHRELAALDCVDDLGRGRQRPRPAPAHQRLPDLAWPSRGDRC